MWIHWNPLFQTLDDSAHKFQSQGGSIAACALLSLECKDRQSHLWLWGPGIESGSLTCEVSTIALSINGSQWQIQDSTFVGE